MLWYGLIPEDPVISLEVYLQVFSEATIYIERVSHIS